ncbi:MAG: hypothetical protein WCC93_00555 [Chthoniobacterales bacterium]|jgi:hypothetical protein|nr:hypothetical protein [Chthoniobacterales bacterium]
MRSKCPRTSRDFIQLVVAAKTTKKARSIIVPIKAMTRDLDERFMDAESFLPPVVTQRSHDKPSPDFVQPTKSQPVNA